MKSIRALRQERGWSQFELALRLEVPLQDVRLWESGRTAPSARHLRRLAGVFDLKVGADESAVRAPVGRRDDPTWHAAEP